jgi:hypothetical protein
MAMCLCTSFIFCGLGGMPMGDVPLGSNASYFEDDGI